MMNILRHVLAGEVRFSNIDGEESEDPTEMSLYGGVVYFYFFCYL